SCLPCRRRAPHIARICPAISSHAATPAARRASSSEAAAIFLPWPRVITLSDGVVVSVNARELADLAADNDVAGISGDLPVRTWMTVSNASTAADQVRAGSPGFFGIGAIPG